MTTLYLGLVLSLFLSAAPVTPAAHLHAHLTTAPAACPPGAPCRSHINVALWRSAWTYRPMSDWQHRMMTPPAGALGADSGAWLLPLPVPSVVDLQALETHDPLLEDGCLGWHAQAVANPRRLGLRWLTVDQATVAALQPGRCNTTVGLDLARLRLLAP